MIVIIFPPFSQIRTIFCQCMNLRSAVCCGARLSFCHDNLLALYVWWMDEKKTKNFAVILFSFVPSETQSHPIPRKASEVSVDCKH